MRDSGLGPWGRFFLMKIVAGHLLKEAYRRADRIERDVFGRSAFNRYYYATFLIVRAGLQQMNADWAMLQHAAIPDMLKGSIKRELAKGKMKAARVGDSALVELCAKAGSAALQLSALMQKGYATRVVADYSPEIPVSFLVGPQCSLNSVGAKDASDWPNKAAVYIGTIVMAWSQIS